MTEAGQGSTKTGKRSSRVLNGKRMKDGLAKESVNAAQALERANRAVLVIPAPELAVLVVTGGDRRSWLNGSP